MTRNVTKYANAAIIVTCAVQDDQHRDGEVEQFPQLERHQRHGQEERQGDRAEVVDHPLVQPDSVRSTSSPFRMSAAMIIAQMYAGSVT